MYCVTVGKIQNNLLEKKDFLEEKCAATEAAWFLEHTRIENSIIQSSQFYPQQLAKGISPLE